MRYYEDDREERIPLLIRLMPLSVLTKFCDFEWKIEKFLWKFQKLGESCTRDTKVYLDQYLDKQ